VEKINQNVRVGREHREAVVELLTQALEAGYLDLSEFDVRMQAVTSAKVVGELVSQVKDLPPQFHWFPSMTKIESTKEPQAGLKLSHVPLTVITFILGIFSVVFSLCGVGGILGVAAVILSYTAERETENSRIFRLWGRWTGWAGIGLSAGLWLLILL
jgi:hypothetical protein